MTADPDGKTGWQNVATGNRASCVVPGLEPGRLYWFRVCAQTASGPGPWAALLVRAGY